MEDKAFEITEPGWYFTRNGSKVYVKQLSGHEYNNYNWFVYETEDVKLQTDWGCDYSVTENGLEYEGEVNDSDIVARWSDVVLGEASRIGAVKGPDPAQTTQKPSNPKDEIGIRKVPMSVVPANVLAEVGVALAEGALKYARHNYRKVGVRGSVYYDATMRHLMSWWEGESIDEDSGLNHVTKAITSLIVLRDSMMQENWVDDRPPKSKPFYPELNQKMSALLDKYKDTNVEHVTELNVRS